MDVIATTERVPPAGQTVYGREFHMAPGGKGANQALQCARLGAEVTMMGCVGDDLFGEKLLEPLRQAGIHLDHVVVRPGVSTGVGHVTLEVTDHTAQNRIVVIPGANRTLTLEEVDWLREEIGSFDLVLLQLEVPIEINRAVARWARRPGAGDAKPRPRHRAGRGAFAPGHLDDPQRAGGLYGDPPAPAGGYRRLHPQSNPPRIAASLCGWGVENVVITLGGRGSVVVEESGLRHVPCVTMDHVADPTAAGDSFVGALAVGVTAGLPREQALKLRPPTPPPSPCPGWGPCPPCPRWTRCWR